MITLLFNGRPFWSLPMAVSFSWYFIDYIESFFIYFHCLLPNVALLNLCLFILCLLSLVAAPHTLCCFLPAGKLRRFRLLRSKDPWIKYEGESILFMVLCFVLICVRFYFFVFCSVWCSLESFSWKLTYLVKKTTPPKKTPRNKQKQSLWNSSRDDFTSSAIT